MGAADPSPKRRRGAPATHETAIAGQGAQEARDLNLAANSRDTDRVALDREARAVQLELKRSGHRDWFECATWWAAEPLDLLRAPRERSPTIGSLEEPPRDVAVDTAPAA